MKIKYKLKPIIKVGSVVKLQFPELKLDKNNYVLVDVEEDKLYIIDEVEGDKIGLTGNSYWQDRKNFKVIEK